MVISLSGPAGRIAVMIASLVTAIEIAHATIQVLNMVGYLVMGVWQKIKHAIPILATVSFSYQLFISFSSINNNII